MQDFFKMDVFFVVTTVLVILVGALVLTVLFYVVRILKSVDHIMENVSEESNDIRGDIHLLRLKIKEEGWKIKHMSDFVSSFLSRNIRSRDKRKKQDSE